MLQINACVITPAVLYMNEGTREEQKASDDVSNSVE